MPSKNLAKLLLLAGTALVFGAIAGVESSSFVQFELEIYSAAVGLTAIIAGLLALI